MRTEHLISIEKELSLIGKLSVEVSKAGFNAENTVVVTVSGDYSSIVGQIMRHNLSFNGEIAEGFSVDVPYPDQEWNSDFLYALEVTVAMQPDMFKNKTLLLVEAGVIRGGNYNFLTDWLALNYSGVKVKTLTLFENVHSVFKSDFVGEFYDDKTQDLTFSWEKFNNHWTK
tara:strand:+ start:15659 stop:16171 length:513 start_codon:yes stop_codon:yes gene_type:complete